MTKQNALSCFYFLSVNLKTFFDEIYQETEKTHRTNNILAYRWLLKLVQVTQDGEYSNIIRLEPIIKTIPQKSILK